jgi:trehalose 6-phosphate synthase/phosphatase
VDRLDYTKGIVARLKAFEQLLIDRPQLAGQVELLQVAVPSRESVPSYAGLSREVETTVEQINDRFGTSSWTPLQYIRESVGPAELVPLYRSADVMLVTSLRDGMNLVAREFVLAREDCDGVLVLSELAGASEDLRAALLVNPYAIDDIAEAMSRALDLEPGERRRRMKALRQRVSARTIADWVQRFAGDVACASGDCQDAARSLVASIGAAGPDRKVALALRYEGLLADPAGGPAPADPDQELLDLLRGLSSRDGLTLHLVSAFDHQTLDRWFDLVPAVIWAEHGLWRREREGHRWRRTLWANADWIDDVRELLQQFVARTPGAFIEESQASLRWHFGRSEHVLGCTQAQTLAAVLRDGAEALGYDVLAGPAMVEVRPAGLSSERTVQKIIEGDPDAQLVLLDTPEHLESARDALRPGDVRAGVGQPGAPGVTALPDPRSLRRVLAEIAAPAPAASPAFLFHGRARTHPRYAPAGAASIYLGPRAARQVTIGR